MRKVLIGTGDAADAVWRAAQGGGMRELERSEAAEVVPGSSAGIALVLCAEEKMEACATELAEKGLDVVLPGWFAGEFSALGRMDAVFSQAGRKLHLLFFDRYAPNILNAGRVLKEGCLGRVGVVDFLKIWPLPDANALFPLAEGLDVSIKWLGDPVCAKGFRTGEEGTDCAALTVRFASGALVNLQAVCSGAGKSWDVVYELSGSEGNLAFDSAHARSVETFSRSGADAAERFPLLNTTVCPVTAALQDLPRAMETQGPGLSRGTRMLANLLQEAFSERSGFHA